MVVGYSYLLEKTFFAYKFSLENFEGFFVEINLRRKKWLLCCSYNPHKNKISSHLDIISKSLDYFSTSYDNLILLGDFNVEPEEKHMANFLNLYNLNNLVHQKTCFKNPTIVLISLPAIYRFLYSLPFSGM